MDTFPQQPLDFFGAIRARVYDDAVRDFILDVGLVGMNEALVGGVESKGKTLGKVNASLERLIQAGHELC